MLPRLIPGWGDAGELSRQLTWGPAAAGGALRGRRAFPAAREESAQPSKTASVQQHPSQRSTTRTALLLHAGEIGHEPPLSVIRERLAGAAVVLQRAMGARTAYRLGAGLDVGLPWPCGVGWEAGVLWPCGVGLDVGLP